MAMQMPSDGPPKTPQDNRCPNYNDEKTHLASWLVVDPILRTDGDLALKRHTSGKAAVQNQPNPDEDSEKLASVPIREIDQTIHYPHTSTLPSVAAVLKIPVMPEGSEEESPARCGAFGFELTVS